jgi:hypothetical protein
MNGTAAAASDMEPVNMAAVPMYSAFRMHPANPGLLSLPRDSANGQLISYNTDYESDNVRFTVWGTGSANTSTIFSHPFALYVAGGDDSHLSCTSIHRPFTLGQARALQLILDLSAPPFLVNISTSRYVPWLYWGGTL